MIPRSRVALYCLVTLFLVALKAPCAVHAEIDGISSVNVYGELDKRLAERVLRRHAPFYDGGRWDAEGVLTFTDRAASLVVELQRPISVRYLKIQADNDDAYILEALNPSGEWERIWVVPPYTSGGGLRTRDTALKNPVSISTFRLRLGPGDGRGSISFISLDEELPEGFRPRSEPGLGSWFFTDSGMQFSKTALPVALAIAVLVAVMRPQPFSRMKHAILLSIGVVGGFQYWNFFTFHAGGYLHVWDSAHYYLGAKYFPELGYTCLYNAAAVAMQERDGDAPRSGAFIRDLATNEIVSREVGLGKGERCKQSFSSDRWRAFSDDLHFFTARLSPDRRAAWSMDHGFNGTPAWLIFGRLLAALSPATFEGITRLAHLDSLFVVLTVGVSWWAFGMVPALVAFTVLGCNFNAGYFWTGGSFLRMDWLFLMFLAAALLKKRRFFLAGCALSYAVQLRVFPLFALLGPIALILSHLLKDRSFIPRKEERQFIAGGVFAFLLLSTVAVWVGGRGAEVFPEFVSNSMKHLKTPLTNDVGLETILSFNRSTRAAVTKDESLPDPFLHWKAARLEESAERVWIHRLVGLLFFATLLVAVRRLELWESYLLGVGGIFVFAQLTCYYLVYFALWANLRRGYPVMPVALLLVCSLTWALKESFSWIDEVYLAQSVLFAALVIFAVCYYSLTSGQEEPRSP